MNPKGFTLIEVTVGFPGSVGVERRHAARGGGGDGLTVGLVLHVACGEDAGNAGGGSGGAARAGRDDVAAVELELALEEGRVRTVADGDEDAFNVDCLVGFALRGGELKTP